MCAMSIGESRMVDLSFAATGCSLSMYPDNHAYERVEVYDAFGQMSQHFGVSHQETRAVPRRSFSQASRLFRRRLALSA